MVWQVRGRTAVVTGASSGIGEATAGRLADAGMTVYAVARRRERLERLAAGHERVIPHVADVTDTASVDALAERVHAERGVCHALVNSAGVPGGRFDGREDLEDALRTLDVNLHGVLRCLAAFATLLEAGAPSRVVNVSSVAGKVGVGPAGYAASKFGVVGLSEALHLSWAKRGITVSQVNPGFIATEGFPQEGLRRSPLAWIVGRPDDVAEAVLETLVRGDHERTVPRPYRGVVVLRHLLGPAFRAAAARDERTRGYRSGRETGGSPGPSARG